MTTAALEVTGLSCRRGGRRVFEHLSFSVAGGELLSLTGPNGSGKSTLLRTVALLGPCDAGQISWKGQSVSRDREAWRRQIAWLGHLDGLKGDLAVSENLRIALKVREDPPERLEGALAAFDLSRLAHREVRTLSAGQRRRVALARVASTQARVWLLDEPLNALDTLSQAALRRVLTEHLAGGGLVVAATHAAIEVARARTLELAP